MLAWLTKKTTTSESLRRFTSDWKWRSFLAASNVSNEVNLSSRKLLNNVSAVGLSSAATSLEPTLSPSGRPPTGTRGAVSSFPACPQALWPDPILGRNSSTRSSWPETAESVAGEG